MNYHALARKWRPQTFIDVVGQEHVLTALANGLALGRVHHAYLFSGTRGVGKTTIARLLAKGLNCEAEITSTPCGHCANCREIEQGRFVDLIEIDAASRTKVEDTRELLDNVQYAPARGRFKIYLIDEVHMLSRHSFNALLKTLEEPPAHVKFLLATTEPQKLPVTILSRCLQFYLKALSAEQIQTQLDNVLEAEHISRDVRALQLLARAADGSMRDALSLTDQAIALGHGQVTAMTVSQMLGMLDDEQSLAIVETLIHADGIKLMTLVEHIAVRGEDWDNLLVEILGLLHQIAMLQLLPSMPDNQNTIIGPRLRDLARVVPPADLQLYYQTLLMGRKDLAYAPNRRMGVEMTLLRALAFHPKPVPFKPEIESEIRLPDYDEGLSTPVPAICTESVVPVAVLPIDNQSAPVISSDTVLPDITSRVLQARAQLLRQKAVDSTKKNKQPASDSTRTMGSVSSKFSRWPIESAQQPQPLTKVIEDKQLEQTLGVETGKKEAYRWQAQHQEAVAELTTTPKELRSVLQHEKTPELLAKLAEEAIRRDPWAAEIAQLPIPGLVQQLALNSFKQQIEPNNVYLHLRSAQRYLNTPSAHKTLTDALSELYGDPIKLSVVEDDDSAQKTPLEWRQVIYEERLAQAHQSIVVDDNIKTLRLFFDADLDEDSIRPI